MRLLFVSSTVVGGSGRSQRELAALLEQNGHTVRFLVDDDRHHPRRRWWYERLSDLSVRWDGRPGAGLVKWFERQPGCRTRPVVVGGRTQLASPVPENAFAQVANDFRPDVVVGNSIIRLAWRKIRTDCARRGVATILYIREVTTYLHLDLMDDPADALVANSRSLVTGAEARGHACAFVPSVIDVTPTKVESDRSVALLINPRPSHGIELLWEIARHLPRVQFEIRESWPLDRELRGAIDRELLRAPNVHFLPGTEPGPDIFARARVLLVPHRIDNRPRVVVEAHANGIPVIASDHGGLREVVGPGGIIVQDDDAEGWAHAIEQMWQDEARYAQLCDAALRHARRREVQPANVVETFETVVHSALSRSRERARLPPR